MKNGGKSFYQVALLQSLTQGYYDGIITIGTLLQHGDTGIGTFDGVNGEMILLDGKVYQALGNGSVQEADRSETVPFSVVTFFNKDLFAALSQTDDINGLKDALNQTVRENGKNLLYMVKINGTFTKMTVRSVLKQAKPYKSLDKALETDQRVFHEQDITGTVVGLYCPDYMSGLNAPGWHFHFIADDRTRGGHVLDLAFDSAQAAFAVGGGFEMRLTDHDVFQQMDLAKDVSDAIRKVETNE